jgi:hypothetical protein
MAASGQRKYLTAVVDAALNADTAIVTAVANHRIAVHGLAVCGDQVTLGSFRLESEAAGTAMTGLFHVGLATGQSILVLPFSPEPWCITDAEASGTDDDLSFEVSNHTKITGVLIYSLIKVR